MKKIKLALLVLLAASVSVEARSSAEIIREIANPRPAGGWVVDEPGFLGSSRDSMNSLITGLEKETTAEIAVVILKTIDENVPKEFATELFRTWGIGKKDKNNGVLVLHVVDQRRIEIETGYGMEGVLTDAKCDYIIQKLTIPHFKKNEFEQGHWATLLAIAKGVRNPEMAVDQLVQNLEIPAPTQAVRTEIPARGNNANIKGFAVDMAVFFVYMTFWFVGLRRLKPRENPYAAHTYLGKRSGKDLLKLTGLAVVIHVIMGFSGLASNTSTFFVLGIPVLYIVIYNTVRRYLKKLPGKCARCGAIPELLDEKAAEVHLSDDQKKKKGDGLNFYHVWKCPSCASVVTNEYTLPGKSTGRGGIGGGRSGGGGGGRGGSFGGGRSGGGGAGGGF